MSQEATFQRSPHDKKNPYSIVSNELIRDESISPNCRWLLIYMLSMKDGWEMKVSQLRNHLKKHMGREKIYSIVNEAIEAGYIKREETKVGNMNRGYTYYVSERAIFKKCLRHTAFREAGIGDTEKTDTLINTNSSSYEEEKKEQYKGTPASPPPSADASASCDLFLRKIRERNPKFKEPNREKWIKEFDLIFRIDKRDVQEVNDLIEWASTHKWWKVACLSPAKLRQDYDAMIMQKGGDLEQESVRKNRQFAVKMKQKYPDQMKSMTFDSKFVSNAGAGKEIPFNLPEETFKDALVVMFGGRRGGR